MNDTLQLSPFSVAYDWKIKWSVVMSSEESHQLTLNQLHHSPDDKLLNMMNALNDIGVIGGVQLSRIFLDGKKKQLKKLYSTRIIKKHELFKDKQIIPIFTLGKTSLDYLDEEPNTWYAYNEFAVLERLLFFQLYERFLNGMKSEKIVIESAESPFVGRLVISSIPFLILVIRNNESSILKYLEKVAPSERIICVCEHLSDLKHINDQLNHLAVRVTTDFDIKYSPINEMFYVWRKNGWEKEHHNRKATTNG